MTTFLADEAATSAAAGQLLHQLPADWAGWTILLSGELGAGESTFARALLWAATSQGRRAESDLYPGRALFGTAREGLSY